MGNEGIREVLEQRWPPAGNPSRMRGREQRDDRLRYVFFLSVRMGFFYSRGCDGRTTLQWWPTCHSHKSAQALRCLAASRASSFRLLRCYYTYDDSRPIPVRSYVWQLAFFTAGQRAVYDGYFLGWALIGPSPNGSST